MSSSLNQHFSAHIITRTPASWQHSPWQKLLSEAITRPEELFELLKLDKSSLPDALLAHSDFALRVPRGYVGLMEPENPDDPLLRQVLPVSAELDTVEGFNRDPVGDLAASKAPGILHKYRGRVLLIATGACAINCRYCFRRHFPYSEQSAYRSRWNQSLDYIAGDKSISEVILSGGDPLLLNDSQLGELIQSIEAIPHVKRLRLHSRLPVVLPERTTIDLIRNLSTSRLDTVLVVHTNHANELGESAVFACQQLYKAGVTLLNQTVILRGINNNADTLAALSEALFDAKVMPYYLHMLDPVQGAAHFDISTEDALGIHTELQNRLPGYLVPRLVKEEAGKASKTWVRN